MMDDIAAAIEAFCAAAGTEAAKSESPHAATHGKRNAFVTNANVARPDSVSFPTRLALRRSRRRDADSRARRRAIAPFGSSMRLRDGRQRTGESGVL
jgi:hypothetical protein